MAEVLDCPTTPVKETKCMIDSRAEIHPSAKIADNVSIGPWSIIGPNVEIDEGTRIDSHVIIRRNTTIGKNNRIYQFVSLGEDPQHIDYPGEDTRLIIGDNNTLRENVTIHRGTEGGGGLTKIGHNNYLMAYSHLGHDCILGNHIMIVNTAQLAGHVLVKDYVTIGAFCAVHQHVTIGEYSFISRACLVSKDILPYIIVCGPDIAIYGLNIVGLRRRGFSNQTIKQLQRAYKMVFRKGIPIKEVAVQLQALLSECPEVQLFIDAIECSKRGVVR